MSHRFACWVASYQRSTRRAFLYKRGKVTPFLGSFHSSELFTETTSGGLDKELSGFCPAKPRSFSLLTLPFPVDYLVNFCVNLDPK